MLSVTAIPEKVDAGGKTHISIELDKEALGTELIYLKLFNFEIENADIATPFISPGSALTGATGNIVDLFTG
ncbi:hypothetical protein, partial [Aeromonas hydrophila]|uniref:hypothetical protein n=1 Tax=Aeromonas hydrophila TaxID=644 RepID=UPI0036D88120